jgi:hypothetical protein
VVEFNLKNCRLQRLQARSDPRGTLIALERGRTVPFEIRRVYYLYGSPAGEEKGSGAHRNLEQLAICVSGAVTFVLDDGVERREVRLDRPDVGLHVGPMIWCEMRDFSSEAVLLVLASMADDEADCFRDYGQFLAVAGGNCDSGSSVP